MRKNNKISIDNEIFSDINKCNFIPLLIILSLYLIGLCHKFNDSRWERRNILGIIFDIFGFIIYHSFIRKIKTYIFLNYFSLKI